MEISLGVIGIGEREGEDPCLVCNNGFTIEMPKEQIFRLKEELEKDGEKFPTFCWDSKYYGWKEKDE